MSASSVRSRYLDLLIESINGSLRWRESVYAPIALLPGIPADVREVIRASDFELCVRETIPEEAYALGEGWPPSRRGVGESMVGKRRLENVRKCVEELLANKIPGDLIETGVWRGGCCILMRGVMAAYDDETRVVYVADSFAGLPQTEREDDDAASLHFDRTLAVSRDKGAEAFARYGLLDDQVRFVEGWFQDTLPGLADRKWSLIRLDGDMYDSTMDALTNLYPRLNPGGFVIVDDYHAYNACRRAVNDFGEKKRISEELVAIDRIGVYWRKTQSD